MYEELRKIRLLYFTINFNMYLVNCSSNKASIGALMLGGEYIEKSS